MFKRGFTLIELLIVVTIIALLVTIGLVSMRGAQAKAKDADIKSYLYQLRNAAEMVQTQGEDYSAVCDETDDTLSNTGEFGILENAIMKYNGNKIVTCIEGADKKSFAASSPLVAVNKHWCVEAAGASTEIDDAITSAKCQ